MRLLPGTATVALLLLGCGAEPCGTQLSSIGDGPRLGAPDGGLRDGASILRGFDAGVARDPGPPQGPPPLDLLLVPAGSLQMGSPPGEPGRDGSEEAPRHLVHISRPLLVKRTEVTQIEWFELMGTSPWSFDACGTDCPVDSVSWWDAAAWCNARSELEDLAPCYVLSGCMGVPGIDLDCVAAKLVGPQCSGYRLPTEAEWEYLARAGSDTALYNGDITIKDYCDAPELDALARYCGNSVVDYPGGAACSGLAGLAPEARCGPSPGGGLASNAFGLLDTLGNAGEWCNDWFSKGYYAESPAEDPEGPLQGEERSARGCSWLNAAGDCRLGARGSLPPAERTPIMGFRPVRTFFAP